MAEPHLPFRVAPRAAPHPFLRPRQLRFEDDTVSAITVLVYPLRPSQLTSIINEFVAVLGLILKDDNVDTRKLSDEKFASKIADQLRSSGDQLAPIAFRSLMQIVSQCCWIEADGKRITDATIEDLPVHIVATIVREWIDFSFGTPERRDPFVQLWREIKTKFLPDLPATSTSETSSPSSSPADIPIPQFSSTFAMDGLTADGASQSCSTGAVAQGA